MADSSFAVWRMGVRDHRGAVFGRGFGVIVSTGAVELIVEDDGVAITPMHEVGEQIIQYRVVVGAGQGLEFRQRACGPLRAPAVHPFEIGRKRGPADLPGFGEGGPQLIERVAGDDDLNGFVVF
jgi:hypothetical protein